MMFNRCISPSFYLLVVGLAVALAMPVQARIDYQRDNSNRPVPIVEAGGTCDHNHLTPFPGKRWSVMKFAGETSYTGPAESGRVFIDKPVKSWELALCRVSKFNVRELLRN